ncbi:MAG: caspase family protein [Rhodospirillaceae bacterium]|nr:caspase family protein [Rhodospirillaceae bacterium]
MPNPLFAKTFALALAIGLSLLGHLSPARAEPRVALVIGNAEYGSEMGRLPNPARDAALMEKSLSAAGFEVIAITDADQKAMKRAISDFGKRLTAAGPDATALFYYSGHGLQVAGENYLSPVQAHITAEADVDLEAISADTILKQMQFASARVNIIILDACRNNPLPRGFRSAQMGLARMEAPRGSFVAYSTAPGEVATDGSGQNSPYTAALAAAITTPGLSIEEAFRTVRGSVLTETGNTQTPWESSSLTAPFFFTPVDVPAEAPDVAQGPREVELAFWNSIKDSKDPADFVAYLEEYPQGNFTRLARNRLNMLTGASVAQAAPPTVETAPATSPDVASAATDAPEKALDNAPSDPVAAAEICHSETAAAEQRLTACQTALNREGLDDIAKADFTNEIGRAHYELSHYDEAIAAYRAAMLLDPKQPAYPANLGLALSDSGKYQEAIAAYDQAVALDPKNVWNFYNRGSAYLNTGAPAKAAADLDAALAIDENFDLLASRGFISLAEGKESDAADYTVRAMATDGEAASLQSIALLYLLERDSDAVAMVDRLIRQNTGYGYGEIWKAMLLMRQGNSGAARSLMAKTLEDHGKDWPGMLMRWMLGKYDDATLLSKAHEGTRQDVQNQLCEANFYLGVRSLENGDKAQAIAFFTDAAATEVFNYIEYHVANAYLLRLKAAD